MKVFEVFRPKRRVEGIAVGIELEYEGKRLPGAETTIISTNRQWNRVEDGSLKRGCSGEFVLAEPSPIEKAFDSLDSLFSLFKDNRTSLEPSVRTGTHVHINAQDLSLVQLYNLFTLYLILEEPLVEWCGPKRVGNLFCLRASDSWVIPETLSSAVKELNFDQFGSNNIRYAAMNVKALHDYGSVEFRALQSTADISVIKNWVSMLVSIRQAAEQYDNPIKIIEEFSMQGSRALARKILGEQVGLLEASKLFEEGLFNGMRNAQGVAYSVDWDTHFKGVGNNPFKKEPRKIKMKPIPVPRFEKPVPGWEAQLWEAPIPQIDEEQQRQAEVRLEREDVAAFIRDVHRRNRNMRGVKIQEGGDDF